MNNAYNLLDEAAFSLRCGGQLRRMTLPQVFAALSGGEVDSFEALQRYQGHPWHFFCVQVAALALHRAGLQAPPKEAEAWRELLLSLSGGEGAAWTLVVEDLSLPAFMQPPVPEGSLAPLKNEVSHPDELDIVVAAKSHDLKREKIGGGSAELWAYALVSGQTGQGFSGRANYGIFRMNGGFGSRVGVGLATGHDLGAHFRRDLKVLLEGRGEHEGSLFKADGGVALMWVEPWDGQTSLALSACDRWVVEVSRRLRLTQRGEEIVAMVGNSAVPRVNASELNGVVGDPWAPINEKEGKSLTVSSNGFDYRLMCRILFSADFRWSLAMRQRPDDEAPLRIWARVLVRGQGKTEGYHERSIAVPKKATRFLGGLGTRDAAAPLAGRVEERVQRVGHMKSKVLSPAVASALQGGPETLDRKTPGAERWLSAFDALVDEAFFPELWEAAELDEDAAREAWDRHLAQLAERVLREVQGELPSISPNYFRALTQSDRIFFGSLKKNFPGLSASAPEAQETPTQAQGAMS